MCSMRGDFKHSSTRQKYNYLKDKWEENYTVESADEFLTTGMKFCISDPAEWLPPLLLPNLVCDITACIRALFPFVKACHDSMSAGVEEYALKADTLFWILFLMN